VDLNIVRGKKAKMRGLGELGCFGEDDDVSGLVDRDREDTEIDFI
jgi:hypothetical protein